MNGRHMNQPPPPLHHQGPENSPHAQSGAAQPHEVAAQPQFGREQGGFQAAEQGSPRDPETTQRIGQVGASNLLNLREFSNADVGKSTGTIGEMVQTGWKLNERNETVPTYRNRFVNKTLRGFSLNGEPVIATTEVPPELAQVIEGIHNQTREEARARTVAPPSPVVEQQAPNSQPGFGPQPAPAFEAPRVETTGQRPAPETRQAPRSRRPVASRNPQGTLRTDEFGRTVPTVESYEDGHDEDVEGYDWRESARDESAAEDTRKEPEPELALTDKAEPAAHETPEPAQTTQRGGAQVGGAVAAEQAARIEDAEEEIPQGVAALGDDVVPLDAQADVHHGGPRRRTNVEHENVPHIPGGGPIVFGM